MRLVVFLLVLFHSPTVFSYNFLVFCPLFGHSHTTFFAKIADVLTDAGHNVTFFTPTIVEKYQNVSYTKSTKDVVHLPPSETLKTLAELLESDDVTRFWTEDSSATEFVPVIQLFQDMYSELGNVLENHQNVLDDLKSRKFDVMIFESYVYVAYPLMEYLEINTFIPSLSITHDIWLSRAIGEPVMPSVVADVCSPFGDRMNILERAANFFSIPYLDLILGYPIHKSINPPHHLIDIPSIEPESSFVFINSNPFVDFPRATLTKTVEIGGISVDLEEIQRLQLGKEWDEVLNQRKKTMLVSFGSVFLSKDMPMIYKMILVDVMRNLPEVTFIWKYEDEDTDGFAKDLENVYFAKWVPQTALLADARLTAFMTHGGLGSVNEVSYIGKPAILCPLFADQMRNTKMLARHNGSIEISKFDLKNFHLLLQTFREILYNPKFAENAKKLSEQLVNQPIKPAELMVKYAEFAARFGKLPSLDPYSRKMTFVEYFLIDVFLICAVLIVGAVWIGRLVIRNCIMRMLVKKRKIE